jgi:4'-phosphopantetheinyl transferase
MQTIFFTNIASLEPFFEHLVLSVRPDRRQKIYSYRNTQDRLRCLAGGLLIEHIGRGKEILYNKYDKPFIPEGPHFNLSHSGDFVCLAVSASSPVGIDIEKHKDEDYLSLAKTAFHPMELAFFLLNPSMERFFKIWTLKESCIKMLGAGFSMEPREFCILPGEQAGILPDMFSPENGQGIFFRSFNRIEGYSLALCAAEPIQAAISSIETTGLAANAADESRPAALFCKEVYCTSR